MAKARQRTTPVEVVTHDHHDALFAQLETNYASLIHRVEPFLSGLYRHYFRCRVRGWENIPEGQILAVGNHNGFVTYEVLMIFYAWWKRFAGKRRVLGLALTLAIDHPWVRWLLPRMGAIPARPDIAGAAVKRGYNLLVYPGGEKEAFRPYREKMKVDFYQRKGFIRLALQTGLPIVPLVSVGAHESFIILDRGERLARKLKITERFRLHGLPITYRSVFFLWCIAGGLVTGFPLLIAPLAFFTIFIPLPARMDFEILPAIDARAMMDPALNEELNLQRIYDHVIEQMQSALSRGYTRRKYPVLG